MYIILLYLRLSKGLGFAKSFARYRFDLLTIKGFEPNLLYFQRAKLGKLT